MGDYFLRRSAVSKTRSASVGQLFELAQVVLRIIPSLSLSAQDVQQQIEHEKDLREVLNLVFRANPRWVDLSQLGILLKVLRKFSPEVRKRLEEEGYKIVEIPAGVTLTSLVKLSEETKEHYLIGEVVPTQSREVAWYLSEPLVPASRNKTNAEQMGIVLDLFDDVQVKFGKEVVPHFPTTEEAAYLALKYQKILEQPYPPPFWTRTANRLLGTTTLGVCFASGGPLIIEWGDDERLPALGILRMIVPQP